VTSPVPEVLTRYFEADASRDIEAITALFTDDAVVVDEDQTWSGTSRIRAWREGPASKYQYTTEVSDTVHAGADDYLVTGRLEGNFPGGTADLKWRFTIAGERIKGLHIAALSWAAPLRINDRRPARCSDRRRGRSGSVSFGQAARATPWSSRLRRRRGGVAPSRWCAGRGNALHGSRRR
jgi:ketosteroid isomerase-like protein